MLPVTYCNFTTQRGIMGGSGSCLSVITVVFITVWVQEPDVILWKVVTVVSGWGLPCSAARGGGSAGVRAGTLKGTAAAGVHLLSPSAAGDGQMWPGSRHLPWRSGTTVNLLWWKKGYVHAALCCNRMYLGRRDLTTTPLSSGRSGVWRHDEVLFRESDLAYVWLRFTRAHGL